MADKNERKKSKGSKGNAEGEEGTDGSKQKGEGGGGKEFHQKKTGLAGAAHFVHKRVTGQPKSTPKKKERKSDSTNPRFVVPAPPSPNTEPKGPQQQQGSTWNPTPWENTSPSVAEPTDPVQSIASASGAVIPSTEEMQSDDIVLPTEGATPPTPMKYDDDTNITTDANVSTFNICMCLLCVNWLLLEM